jgi:hypothetical protein
MLGLDFYAGEVYPPLGVVWSCCGGGDREDGGVYVRREEFGFGTEGELMLTDN